MANKTKVVIIIEDDASLVQMYRLKFELEGYEVHTASTGQEGLAVIKEFQPDIVLLDLLLPGMSGTEVLENVRALPNGRSIKIVVLTNVKDETIASRVYRAGPVEYMTKADVTPEEVFRRVKKIIDKASKLAGPPGRDPNPQT